MDSVAPEKLKGKLELKDNEYIADEAVRLVCLADELAAGKIVLDVDCKKVGETVSTLR